MRKILGNIVFAIFAIAVLVGVYFFVTKGYSGKKISLLPSTQTPVPEASTKPGQVTGNIASDKITLVVTSPEDGATLNSTNVTVKGKTTPGADVFINDVVGKADAKGNFSISIGLDEGVNQIVVLANDASGNVTQQNLSVKVVSF